MTATSRDLRSASVNELTRVVLGAEMSLGQLTDLLEVQIDDVGSPVSACEADTRDTQPDETPETVWAGSIGYELYRDVDQFADALSESGVERLLDVRELPISRRPGYAKSALAAALKQRGIEYVHLRELGNPKPIRDLWKSGAVEKGRSLYRDHLLDHKRHALWQLPSLLKSKRSVIMCYEHDEDICHRQVIFECLRDELGVELATEQLLNASESPEL